MRYYTVSKLILGYRNKQGIQLTPEEEQLFKYGYDKFLQKAKNSGICGVIIPDLPYEEKDELSDTVRGEGGFGSTGRK